MAYRRHISSLNSAKILRLCFRCLHFSKISPSNKSSLHLVFPSCFGVHMRLMYQKMVGKYIERCTSQVKFKYTSCLVCTIANKSFVAPGWRIAPKNKVRLIGSLVALNIVDFSGRCGVVPLVIRIVVTGHPRLVEHPDASILHQLQ